MRSVSTPAVLIIAKAPRPGSVKTRLQPLLGPQGCAVLQAELIRHTPETASGGGLRAYLAYAAEHAPDSGCAPASAGARIAAAYGTPAPARGLEEAAAS